jgi:hypothetical protein
MRETNSTQGICPKIPAPVCHLVSVCDQQALAMGSKGFHTNVTYVDNDVGIVVLRLSRGKVLKVGIL